MAEINLNSSQSLPQQSEIKPSKRINWANRSMSKIKKSRSVKALAIKGEVDLSSEGHQVKNLDKSVTREDSQDPKYQKINTNATEILGFSEKAEKKGIDSSETLKSKKILTTQKTLTKQ